jgi:aryl sulfotransferase
MDLQLTPRQTPQRTYRSFTLDSKLWDRYEPRPGDIVISTPAKVGTTWTQRIASVLVFQSTELPAPLLDISPWLESPFVPIDVMLKTLEEQEHRRFIKCHLPMDALPIYDEVSYIIVGRDLRDAAVSTHNQMVGMNDSRHFQPPGLPSGDDVYLREHPEVPTDIREFWQKFFTESPFPWESNGWPYNSPTYHLESFWKHRDDSNIIFLHYQDMLDDLDKEMRRVSAFLDIPVNEEIWPSLVEACTFSDMKAKKDKMFAGPMATVLNKFEFFHKGTNGQWVDVLSERELAVYEAAMEPLPADLRSWLARSARA